MIRRANRNDLEKIIVLHQELHLAHVEYYPSLFKPVADEEIRKLLTEAMEDENVILLVAAGESDIIGYLLGRLIRNPENILMYSLDYCFVDQIVVHRPFRGKGIGGELLEELQLIATDKGATRIDLMVMKKNSGAVEFYKGNGFSTISMRLTLQL